MVVTTFGKTPQPEKLYRILLFKSLPLVTFILLARHSYEKVVFCSSFFMKNLMSNIVTLPSRFEEKLIIL